MLAAVAIGLAGQAYFALPAGASNPALRFPDLRTEPPDFIFIDADLIGDEIHYLVRFTTSVWNAGEGPLELRGVTRDEATVAYQRLYDDHGGFFEREAGTFVLHSGHRHWHFERFADYELWTRAEWDHWIASGRVDGVPGWRGSKTTGQGESFCVRDSDIAANAVGVPADQTYLDCDREVQGVSVGWADVYPFHLPDQWVDVGREPLPDGDYVLRIVADPGNLLFESEGGSDAERESARANEAIVTFKVEGSSTQLVAE